MSALRVGAVDFITEPTDGTVLTEQQLREPLAARRSAVAIKSVGTVGDSCAMKQVYDLVARVADTDISVLIHGETGTGKELVARSIHASSARRSGPFVAINCAAVPAALLESELFGHARGAFTDAKAQRAGLFVHANGGTLLLDEVGELPLEIQPKLLRALQERTVRPVGGENELPFDARILSATNRNVEQEVRERRFREDLYYRLNVVQIDLPPLRERGLDVLELARHLLLRSAERGGRGPLTLSPSAADRLMAYTWPGNVRELENCIERAVALARYDQVTVEDLPERMRGHRGHSAAAMPEALSEVERRHVLRVLSHLGGNKTLAAEKLGIDRRTLYRMLARYDLAVA